MHKDWEVEDLLKEVTDITMRISLLKSQITLQHLNKWKGALSAFIRQCSHLSSFGIRTNGHSAAFSHQGWVTRPTNLSKNILGAWNTQHAVIGGGKPYEQLFSSITIIDFQELAHALHQHLDPALDVTDPQGAQCTQTVGVRDVLCT